MKAGAGWKQRASLRLWERVINACHWLSNKREFILWPSFGLAELFAAEREKKKEEEKNLRQGGETGERERESEVGGLFWK